MDNAKVRQLAMMGADGEPWGVYISTPKAGELSLIAKPVPFFIFCRGPHQN